MNIDLKQLRELMRAIRQFDVSELEIWDGDQRIFLRRGGAGGGATAGRGAADFEGYAGDRGSVAPQPPQAPHAHAAAVTAAADETDPNMVYVTSPFVGTFYRSPNPQSPPFIDVGQDFKAGQPLCIVEAMKLMNEIEAEFKGTILEVLIENGKTVEYGDKLFKVRKA
jgi:acetyl-CoA carboxylase biotin carboxyl carrier protein